MLWHNTLWYGAREDARRRGHGGYDFAPLLAGMKPVIASADMAICHEEVPLARPGGPYRNFPLLAAPPQVVKAISATGYDVCTTASNHSVDQGFAGLKRTLDDLDRSKIAHVGTARTKAESQRPTIFTTKQGVKIAIVAATFSLNGLAMRRAGRGPSSGRVPRPCWVRRIAPARLERTTDVLRGAEGATGRFTLTRVGDGRFSVTKAEYIPTLVTHYQQGRPARLYQVSTALKTAKGSFRSRLLDAQRRTTAVVMRKHPQGLTRG